MRTIELPGVPVAASVVGLGTMIFGPGTVDRDHALLDAFVAGGGSYIDTAEVYGAVEGRGESEEVIGSWLAARPGMRERIVLASKGLIPGYCEAMYPGGASISPSMIGRAIEGSLGRLQTDQLDVWMLHRDDPSQPVGPLVEAFHEQVELGRIRAYGGSNWSVDRVQAALTYADEHHLVPMTTTSNQLSLAVAYAPYWPGCVMTSDHDRSWFRSHEVALVAWSALARGFFAHGDPGDRSDADLVRTFYSETNFERKRRALELADRKGMTVFEIALAYVTSLEFSAVALSGAQTTAEVDAACRAASIQLTPAECAWLDLRRT